MFKTVTLCSLFVLSIITPFSAFADSVYPYASLKIGTPLTSIYNLSDSSGSLGTTFKPGYMAGLAAGITFETKLGWNIERIRTEAEIAYRSNELKYMKNTLGRNIAMNGTATVTNYMVNGYLENSIIQSRDLPAIIFITAGAGAAKASISSISYQGAPLVTAASDTQFAYQGGGGIGFELTKTLTLDAAYMYLGAAGFNLAGVVAKYDSHNVLFGARYLFK